MRNALTKRMPTLWVALAAAGGVLAPPPLSPSGIWPQQDGVPERLLAKVFDAMDKQQLADARRQADALVLAYPTYFPALVVRDDLMRIGPAATGRAPVATAAAAHAPAAAKLAGRASPPLAASNLAGRAAPPLAAAGASASAPLMVSRLLERARLWQGREREDMARLVLDKLFQIDPDQPDALAMLADLQRRQPAQMQATLARLKLLSPQHPALERLQARAALRDQEQARLQTLRAQARNGQIEQALDGLRAMYPGAPLEGALALEYWQLLARTDDGVRAARAGLRKLADAEPDNLGYRLALAEAMTGRGKVEPAWIDTIVALTEVPALSQRAREAWRTAVLRLDPVAASVPLLQAYLVKEPGDSAAAQRLSEVGARVAEHERLMADPFYRDRIAGQALLEAGDLDGAEARLEQALLGRAGDPELLGAYGTLRLRQGRHADARASFDQAAALAGGSGQWRRMSTTAQYWGLLREAGDARDGAEYELALFKLAQAHALDPDDIHAVLGQARVLADQQRGAEAEQAYRAVLKLKPNEPSALAGLMTLLLDDGREQQMQAELDQLAPALRLQLQPQLARRHGSLLRGQADAAAKAGDPAAAAVILERAVQVDPHEPWLRHDLAQLYAQQGREADGLALFDALLARAPDDAATLHAKAQFESSRARAADALATLERIAPDQRGASTSNLQRRLWLDVQQQRARQLHEQGQLQQARAVMQQVQDAFGASAEVGAAIATSWAAIGQPEQALHLIDQLHASARQPQWLLQRARIQAQLGDDATLAATLARIDPAVLDAQQLQQYGQLQQAMVLRQAESLDKLGRLQQAWDLLATLAPQQGVLAAQAPLARKLGWPDRARQCYVELLKIDPRDHDSALALTATLAESGRASAARSLTLQLAGAIERLDAGTGARLLDMLMQQQQWEAARAVSAQLLSRAQPDARALAIGGRLALHDGQPLQAIALLQHSLALQQGGRAGATDLAPAPGAQPAWLAGTSGASPLPSNDIYREPASGAYRELAGLLDQNNRWLGGALAHSSRAGRPGVSQFQQWTAGFDWQRPLADGRRLALRAELVRIDAGRIEQDEAELGTLALPHDVLAPRGPQQAAGVALGAVLEGDALRLDLGTTPLGFALRNVVGGLLYKGELGPLSYSVDASRRLHDGSLLSAAGMRDPVSGRAWGGVVASGVRLGLSRDDGGAVGAWSSFGLHRLTGTEVAANTRAQAMGGAYWRVVNRDDATLTVGANALRWRFSQNAGEYSFGHGGYYSPASFNALSLPVSFGQRGERFSYMVRMAASRSWSRGHAAPLFPTDAALQAAADGRGFQAAPRSRGSGRSLSAMLEYQLTARTFVGAKLELDRSIDYSPARAMLYMRTGLDRAAARPVAFAPQPMTFSSQY